MTIVGQCIGAGRKDEAVYYIKKLCMIAEVILIISCLSVFVLTKPITILGGMEKESAKVISVSDLMSIIFLRHRSGQ